MSTPIGGRRIGRRGLIAIACAFGPPWAFGASPEPAHILIGAAPRPGMVLWGGFSGITRAEESPHSAVLLPRDEKSELHPFQTKSRTQR